MYLKFKMDDVGNHWKTYECKNYEHKKFKLSQIIDYILEKQFFELKKVTDEIPQWLVDADLVIMPDLQILTTCITNDKGISHLERVTEITDQHIKLLNNDCMLFAITTMYDPAIYYVLTTNQVFVESDKGQTVGRFNLN